MKKEILVVGISFSMVAAMVPGFSSNFLLNKLDNNRDDDTSNNPAANTPTTGGSLTVFTQWEWKIRPVLTP